MGKPARILKETLRRHDGSGLRVDEFTIDSEASVVRKNDEVVVHLRPFTKLKPLAWVRLSRTLRLAEYDIVHLTNQTLAFLAGRFSNPTVLTVWDLIELLEPQERFGRPVARFLYSGIPRADHVITVSRYTADTVQKTFHIPDHRLTIVPPAASSLFRFFPNLWDTVGGRDFLLRNKLSLMTPRVLYAGSEHPRKNLRRLLEAIAVVRREIPEVQFVKIGSAGSASGRAEFVATADRLALWPSIRRVEEALDHELLFWYHAATVCAFPTLFEGFGFPPLEAMACGTPVVTADRTSLPEVVGDAAVMVRPEHVEDIADGLLRVLTDAKLQTDLREKGLQQAGTFTQSKTVAGTRGVYEKVLQRESRKGER